MNAKHVTSCQVWRGEAFDFTPWLGSGPRHGPGVRRPRERGRNFFIDTLARDLNRDRVTLIENQLEVIDHGHLGQLITYAAGLDATTIV
jgi:hypothetical protein